MFPLRGLVGGVGWSGGAVNTEKLRSTFHRSSVLSSGGRHLRCCGLVLPARDRQESNRKRSQQVASSPVFTAPMCASDPPGGGGRAAGQSGVLAVTIRELETTGWSGAGGGARAGAAAARGGAAAGAAELRAGRTGSLSLVERCPTGNVAPSSVDPQTNPATMSAVAKTSKYTYRSSGGGTTDVNIEYSADLSALSRLEVRARRRPPSTVQCCAVTVSPRYVDVVRLLHDDLESERELRQRVRAKFTSCFDFVYTTGDEM
ncbi:Paramyosin, long form [Eumeta japonica]|uniref:Paramyosin, long form n=1 Tax=Eumeta variegata TaxID=151549 RepID=A0A4C2AD98_EUMVA|nr:Paramyosin, long form [Eumeta japonica]